ncbi:Spy0128 family protein [Thermophilibacter sp.]
MRKGLKRFGGALRRVATVGVTAALALGMAVTGPVSAIAEEVAGGTVTTKDGVTLSKTATWDDEVADQANVELSIGSTESKDKVAVMFVLDKSTSQGMRDEAAKMLDYLKGKSNTDIIYNVVIFSGTATSTGWQNIADDATLDATKANFVNGDTTSGTNMDAGIEEAISQMKSLPADYADAESYLVTLSDGITYVWTGDDGQVKCVPVQGLHDEDKVESAAQNQVDTWDMMYDYGVGIEQVYGTFEQFLSAVPGKMNTTESDGHVQNYYGENSKANPISTYIYDAEKQALVQKKYACGPEFAMYESATGYASLVQQFDHAYAYAVPELDSNGNDNLSNWNGPSGFPWGQELMTYLASLSDNGAENSYYSNADADKLFAGIQDQILYEIESGTVTDVIGNDFDLAGLDTIKMSVGSTELKGTVDEAAGTVTFGDKGEYVVSYTKAEDGTETLTWKIGAPVESANGVKLSYALNLANKSTVPGTYPVDTNEKATLTYESTGGDRGEGTFPVPELSYTVDALDPAITGGFVAKKELVDSDGNELDLKDGQFKFQVKDAEGSVIDEATNDAEGNIRFKKDMTFNDAGDYTYTISEVNDGQEGITYDTDDVTVTVHVADTDDDGDLDATWSYADDDMTFTNVSTAKATVPSTSTSNNGNLPKTSDPTSLVGAGVALVGGLGASAAGLVLRRRNK